MIVLDTNVVSELMRAAPNKTVLSWFDRQRTSELYVTALTQAEVMHGVRLLPAGRRREKLALEARALFESDFDGRILPFESDAAVLYAELMVARRADGRPLAIIDAQIAAIAGSRAAPLATRNTPDFEGCGLTLLDPWRET